jgi:hypothetical protein
MIDAFFRSRRRMLATAAVVFAATVVGLLAEIYPGAELNGLLFGLGTLAIGTIGLIATYAAFRVRVMFEEARNLWRELARFEDRFAQAKEEAQALRYDLDRSNTEKDALRDRVALAERRLARLAIKTDASEDLRNT